MNETSGVAVCCAFKQKTFKEPGGPAAPPPNCLSLPDYHHILNSSTPCIRRQYHKTFTTTSCRHTSVICLFLVTRGYWAQSVQKDIIWKENHQPLHLSFTTTEDFKVWHQNYISENSGFNQTVGRRGNVLGMITLTSVSFILVIIIRLPDAPKGEYFDFQGKYFEQFHIRTANRIIQVSIITFPPFQ